VNLIENGTETSFSVAAKILIDYTVLRPTIASWDQGSDVVFSPKIEVSPPEPGVLTKWEGPIRMDAYKVRDAFEKTDNSEAGVRKFLNSAGPFWPFDSVRLSQFREWQALVKLIRRDDFDQLARTDPNSRQAVQALNHLPNTFFNFEHPDDTAERQHAASAHPEVASMLELARKWRAKQIRELMDYFASPQLFQHSCDSPEAGKKIQRVQPDAFPSLKSDNTPILVYKPTNVLEAIAVTIAVDAHRRIVYRACLSCGDLFLRTKKTQSYCTRTGCKGKARTARRTNESHTARAFYLGKREAGLDAPAIAQMAATEGLKLTPREIKRAEKAFARKRPPATSTPDNR
jgi:hypothetical protein